MTDYGKPAMKHDFDVVFTHLAFDKSINQEIASKMNISNLLLDYSAQLNNEK